MGCKNSRSAEYGDAGCAGDAQTRPLPGSTSGVVRLEPPEDDVLPWACGLGDGRLAASGIDGTVYVYGWERRALLGRFSAHRKAVNRLLPTEDGLLFTASADATVRLWRVGGEGPSALGAAQPQPELTLEGHRMSVQSLALVGRGARLFTGSRDCTVRLWDVATGAELQQNKILRNVVTAVRHVPGQPSLVVQASEDLQLRLWDTREKLSPAAAVPGGPNQLICLDVADDGSYVACGSKGFSRSNCEVKVYDLRKGLAQLAAAPCADQTIEALRMVGPDRCLIAGKDGHIRVLAMPEARVLEEWGPSASAYTALGVERRPDGGPVALAATAGPNGPGLELLEWADAGLSEPARLLAATSW